MSSVKSGRGGRGIGGSSGGSDGSARLNATAGRDIMVPSGPPSAARGSEPLQGEITEVEGTPTDECELRHGFAHRGGVLEAMARARRHQDHVVARGVAVDHEVEVGRGGVEARYGL